MVEVSYEAFKEPRGFLKILQWLFGICAFATTVNFSSISSVNVICPMNPLNVSNVTTHLAHEVQYPFDLDQPKNEMPVPVCKPFTLPSTGKDNTLHCSLVSNAKSDSEFFVTTGVLTFLYATGFIALFLFADNMYTANNRIPKIDFWITLVFAVFWLAGSSAWSNGLSGVRAGADPTNWQVVINSTDASGKSVDIAVGLCDTASTGFVCDQIHSGSFGGIVISILFGFINVILWGSNLWFLYKETPWFDNFQSNGHPSTSGQA